MGALKKETVGILSKPGTRGGGGGWGLTESTIFVEKIQTQFCRETVHKFDERHTTQMGRQYLINS